MTGLVDYCFRDEFVLEIFPPFLNVTTSNQTADQLKQEYIHTMQLNVNTTCYRLIMPISL